MLSKTIKLGSTLLFVAAFIVGCASSSQTEEPTSAPEPAAAPAVTAPSTTSAPEPQAPELATVFLFDFDQSTLNPDVRSLLTAHAAALRANPESIRLEGHADERGTREYNLALGERRALAVRDYLRSEGVTSPIEVVSYGEERPAVNGSDEFAWSQNRRVELIK